MGLVKPGQQPRQHFALHTLTLALMQGDEQRRPAVHRRSKTSAQVKQNQVLWLAVNSILNIIKSCTRNAGSAQATLHIHALVLRICQTACIRSPCTSTALHIASHAIWHAHIVDALIMLCKLLVLQLLHMYTLLHQAPA